MQTPKGEINDKILELINDEEAIAKMKKANSAKEAYELVKDRVGISFEEFQSSMKIANEYVNNNEEGELSEDDLDAVAGGKANPSINIPGTIHITLPDIHFKLGPIVFNCSK